MIGQAPTRGIICKLRCVLRQSIFSFYHLPVYIINWCSLSAESAVASVTIVVEGVSIDSAQYHQTESQNTSRVGGCYGGISTFYLKKEKDCPLTSNHDLAGNRERSYLLGSEIEAIISFKYCLHKSC